MLANAKLWVKILGIILGLIAAVVFIPWANTYIWWALAFLGGIAVGVVVYLITLALFGVKE